MEYIVDTSVFVALAINEPVSDELKRLLKSADSAEYSVVSLVEAYPVIIRKGLKRLNEENQAEALRLLKENYELLAGLFRAVPVNKFIAIEAGELSLNHWDDGLSYVDCIIAATAKKANKTVLTLDTDFSKVKELKTKIIEWKKFEK